MENDNISKRIKLLLKESGIKQSYLADKLGVQRQAISRLLNSKVIKSKYFSEIASVLGVSTEYLILGDRKPIVFVDDLALKNLITRNFILSEEEKINADNFYLKSNLNCTFFAYKLNSSIDSCFPKDSLLIYAAKQKISTEESKIYILLSNINYSFIVGKYSKNEYGQEVLKNENGSYLIQENDVIVGQAVQAILFLGD